MKSPKKLTAPQVLKRMRQGEKLFMLGGSSAAIFEDGTRVTHMVMNQLRKSNMILRPLSGSLYSPFTLTHPATHPVPVVGIARMHEEYDYNQ